MGKISSVNKMPLTPMLYALGDSAGMDVGFNVKVSKIHGNRKGIMEVFEGYSPTVVTEITHSIVDMSSGIVAICVRVWGNLNVLIIYDSRMRYQSMYVYDKSKVREDSTPWDSRWSRKHTYKFLESCVKGIYWKSEGGLTWTKLEQGVTRLGVYNDMRKKGATASAAYITMWGDK